MITQKANGRWLLDIEPRKGKRFRRTRNTKAECKRLETQILAKFAQDPEFATAADDKRALQEIIDLWFELHGHTLKDGFRRKRAISAICAALGNPLARKLSVGAYLVYRKQRLAVGLTPKTLNNELTYLRAVYNELFSLQQINYSCPLSAVKPLRVPDRELTWLNDQQIAELFTVINARTAANANPHLSMIVELSLATGGRWSEIENLVPGRVRENLVTFVETKNGKSRSVPVSHDLQRKVHEHWMNHGMFTSTIGAFRRALERSTILLPKGQAAHVLRHTFASHFVMNGGNIVTLKTILGHSSIKTTMRYAHLCPEYLNDALSLNPLSSFDSFSTPKQKNQSNRLIYKQ